MQVVWKLKKSSSSCLCSHPSFLPLFFIQDNRCKFQAFIQLRPGKKIKRPFLLSLVQANGALLRIKKKNNSNLQLSIYATRSEKKMLQEKHRIYASLVIVSLIFGQILQLPLEIMSFPYLSLNFCNSIICHQIENLYPLFTIIVTLADKKFTFVAIMLMLQ